MLPQKLFPTHNPPPDSQLGGMLHKEVECKEADELHYDSPTRLTQGNSAVASTQISPDKILPLS